MEKLIYKDKEYSDCIYTKQNTKLPFWMRLSILFGTNFEIDIKTYTENVVGGCISEVKLNTYDIFGLIKDKFKKKNQDCS